MSYCFAIKFIILYLLFLVGHWYIYPTQYNKPFMILKINDAVFLWRLKKLGIASEAIANNSILMCFLFYTHWK